MRNNSSAASASATVPGEFTGVSTCTSSPPDACAMADAAHMFSNTVSDGKTCATWNERDMPSRVISRDGRPVMSRSSNQIDALASAAGGR